MMEKRVDDVLIIFAKAPIPGLAKTRLFPHLTFDEAAELHRAFLMDTVNKAMSSRRFRVCLAYTPANSLNIFKDLYGGEHMEFMPQHEGDIGERMSRAFSQAFENGAGKAAIIGTDIPTLPAHYISAAFKRLDRTDLVVGPSKDGGYYLVAMKRHTPALFEGIAWSGPEVLKETLKRVRMAGLKAGLMPPLRDVDTFDDLKGLLGARLPVHTHRMVSSLADRLKAQADWLV